MAKQKSTSVTCQICGRVINRESDMARHLLLHAENKEDNMHRCKYDGCKHMTLQEANLRIHERIHTGKRPLECRVPGCNFQTAHPSSMTRHRQKRHSSVPNRNSESLHQPADSRSTTRGLQRFSPYPHQIGNRNQTRDAHLATTSRLGHAPLASGSGNSTASRLTITEHQQSHQPSDNVNITRRQQRSSPSPQQVGEGSRRLRVRDTHFATTSQPYHGPLASGSGTSIESRVTTAEHQPSYEPLPQQARLDAFDAVVLTVINGSFDDLDSLFSDRSSNVTPVNCGPYPLSPLAQHSVVGATTPTPSPVSISPVPRSVNHSPLSSSHSSPALHQAVLVNSGSSHPSPMVQHSFVATPVSTCSSLSLALSSVNDSPLLTPLLSLPPVGSHGSDDVPVSTPPLSPLYELQYGSSHLPTTTQASRALPAYNAQYPSSSYGCNSFATVATSPAAQSDFSQSSLVTSPDTTVWPRALVDAGQRYLGQSYFHTTTTATNTTIYSGGSTNGGFEMQGLYTW